MGIIAVLTCRMFETFKWVYTKFVEQSLHITTPQWVFAHLVSLSVIDIWWSRDPIKLFPMMYLVSIINFLNMTKKKPVLRNKMESEYIFIISFSTKDIDSCKEGRYPLERWPFHSTLQRIYTMVMRATLFHEWWNSPAAPFWENGAHPYNWMWLSTFADNIPYELVWFPILLILKSSLLPIKRTRPECIHNTAEDRVASCKHLSEKLPNYTQQWRHSFFQNSIVPLLFFF